MIVGGKSKPKITLVRIRKRIRPQHHAGAWKVAYADFVTAMMAFFLLMWIGTTVNKSKIEGIADYFNTPLFAAARGGSQHGDQDAVIKGSGTDITRKLGQASHGHPTAASVASHGAGPRPSLANLAGLKGSIEASIAKNNQLSQFKPQIIIAAHHRGVVLQITDSRQLSLFVGDSAQLTPAAGAMLQALGHVLGLQSNRLSIEGHTDASPYAGPKPDYSNWELSLDRANACRRAMLAGGLPVARILRVVGLGSAVPILSGQPKAAANRRISITLLTDRAARAIQVQSAGGLKLHDEAKAPAG